MTIQRLAAGIVLSLVILLPGSTASAQSVTMADIQRLQDGIYDASRDVEQVRDRDSRLYSQLQADLDDARDETIYLKVKIRKNEPIARNEYSDLRDRIESVRSRARDDRSNDRYNAPSSAPSSNSTSSPPVRTSAPNEIPVDTEFDVRLQDPLNSGTSQVEDRFTGTTMVDLMQGNSVLVPAGSVMRGVVSSVNKAGRIERKGSLTVAFDQITVNGRSYPIRATVTQALESEGVKGEVGKIGTGAGVGAIIGGILGGFKGALAGILIGGGGTIAATEGKDVELQPGTVLRVRLDSPLTVR